MKKRNIIRRFFCVFGCLIFLAGCRKDPVIFETETMSDSFGITEESAEITAVDSVSGTKEANHEILFVYVCGAVVYPGVYELSSGSRVYEAVEMAGGMREDAASESLNMAELLTDGQQLRILTLTEAETLVQASESVETSETGDGKININTASREVLMTLSGIGEAKADAIISYRNEHGKFQSTEDIMLVPGIKEAAYRRIEDRITTGSP